MQETLSLLPHLFIFLIFYISLGSYIFILYFWFQSILFILLSAFSQLGPLRVPSVSFLPFDGLPRMDFFFLVFCCILLFPHYKMLFPVQLVHFLPHSKRIFVSLFILLLVFGESQWDMKILALGILPPLECRCFTPLLADRANTVEVYEREYIF